MHDDALYLVQRKAIPETRGFADSPFAKAAETIAAISGRAKTVVDVLHHQAFRHHAEALRQYLVHRLGDVARGDRALAELRAWVATEPTEALVAPPGIRAQLYRRARDHAQKILVSEGPPPASARQALPYKVTPGRELTHGLLQALRLGLPDELAELLELRYARDLSPEELAYVLDAAPAAIEASLAEATARVERLLSPRGLRERGCARVIVDALALAPATAERASSAEGDEAWEPLPPGTVIGGRYSVVSRVVSGAFGDVYRADDTEVPGHVVALKLLHHAAYGEEARQAALRELRLIASVFHPSVVQFKDHGWYDGRLWFVMPWYEGETLDRRIERAPLTRGEALRIFEPLARALAAMHAAGIRHQDVKPDNIFLARLPGESEDDVLPVLLDLGVAATEAEMVVAGTPTYFAPEVAARFTGKLDAPPITLKTDVFSLALALRNALEPTTKEEVRAGAVEAFIAERTERAPAAPSARELRFLGAAFKRWMALDPGERPSAEALAEELQILIRPEVRRRRRKALFAVVAPIVAIAVTVFVVAVSVLQSRARERAAEAEEARAAAATLREDLSASEERERALEARRRAMVERYERSRSSLQDIAGDLVATQDDLTRARAQIASLDRERGTLREQLAAEREQARKTAATLETTRRSLADAEARITRLEEEAAATARELDDRGRRLADATERLAAVTERLAATEAESTRMRGELAAAEGRLSGEQARAARLEQGLADAEAARARAESALADAERRLAQRRPPPSDAPGASSEPPSDAPPAPEPPPDVTP
jgi:hypothetical protein